MKLEKMIEKDNQQAQFKLKKDRYRSIRGGEAHLLDISCTKCGSFIAKYQKDGKGNLFRLYLNRILYPSELESLQYKFTNANIKQLPALKCISCDTLMGVPMIYSDGRPVFRLIKGAYHKKLIF